MKDKTETADVLVSEFAADEDMAELVEFFVAELPERISSIETALADENFAKLTMLAHQLKGSAGGYGFPSITDAARQLEDTATTTQDVEKLTVAANALVTLCRRARAN